MRLLAYNPSTTNLEKTYLSTDYAAGQTTLVMKNTNSFAVNDTLLIGEMGREKSELATIQTVNANKITIVLTSGTSFPHSSDDPVYQLRYDSIRFYRSTTGVDGTYNFLSTVPIDVDNLLKETYYNDDSGLPSYYYKISYYNSISAVESDLSDPMPGQGYARSQVGSVVNDFLEEVSDLEQNYVTVPQIISWMNEVNDDLFSQSRKPYRFLRRNPPWTLSTTQGDSRIPLPSDLTFIDFIKYQYNYAGGLADSQVDIVSLEYINELIAANTSIVTSDDVVQCVAIDETTNELVLYPTPLTSQTDIFTIYGWTSFSQISDLGDTLQTPTPRVYKLFLLARFWLKRSIKESAFRAQADRYERDYQTEIVKMQRANRVDLGSPRGMIPDVGRSRYYYYGNKYR